MKKYDVLVAGGGISGVSAAVAAARQGKNVLLVERSGVLGGQNIEVEAAVFIDTTGGAHLCRLAGEEAPSAMENGCLTFTVGKLHAASYYLIYNG